MTIGANENLGPGADGDYDCWPDEVREIHYRSAGDDSDQPAMYYSSGSRGRPLLVALHGWSSDHNLVARPYGDWCIDQDWVLMYPGFRGPNDRPEACGSELVVADILGTVAYARQAAGIDESHVYLMGGSGGGHLAMLMAGRAPQVWAGVSAWVGISDIQQWYYEMLKAERGYATMTAQVCGGVPEPGSAAEEQCRLRSPLTYLPAAGALPLDIAAGIHDGHTGSVPISHSFQPFNRLAQPQDRVRDEQIRIFVEQERVPDELVAAVDDPDYGERQVLFRRQSNRVRITIFEGGHEIIYEPALHWLSKQRREL